MKRQLRSIYIFLILGVLLVACNKKKVATVEPVSEPVNNESIVDPSSTITATVKHPLFWPTLYFDGVYYQSDRFETMIEPENISFLGVVDTVCKERDLPTGSSEVNYEAYVGYEIHGADQEKGIYLKYENTNGNIIYSKWSARTTLQYEVTADWYPSVMVNDHLYWHLDYMMVDALPEDGNYVEVGQVLYQEGSCATMNFSNSIHMIGANIYISTENKEVIYVGYGTGPFAELVLVE